MTPAWPGNEPHAPARLLLPAGRIGIEQAAALPGVDRAVEQGRSLVLETASPGKVLRAVDALTGLDGVMTRTAAP
ncbi:hypothetical protein [Streptomyces antarcticus]|uniref:hypothetical protein n=1 Tax=Streptomyces antarcticus TaxID=2996458 RepID=UPI002D1E4148|nr:hypothetical protein [Streptomyces sp. H34-AA3]